MFRTKPYVCEKGFPSFKIQISYLQYEASFLFSSQTKYCASLTTRKYFYTNLPTVPDCQIYMFKHGVKFYKNIEG